MPEPDEPVDDYVPRRRRRQWAVSPLGLLLVGGLGVAVLIAVGGVVWKLSGTKRQAAPTTVTDRDLATERRRASPGVKSTGDGTQREAPRPVADRRAEVLLFFAVLAGGVLFAAVVIVLAMGVKLPDVDDDDFEEDSEERGGHDCTAPATAPASPPGPIEQVCYSCGGTGNGSLACLLCRGRGNDGAVVCFACNGRGTDTCMACGGTGRIRSG
jgi:hypothetical protein